MLRKAKRLRRFAAALPQMGSFWRGYSTWRRAKLWPAHDEAERPSRPQNDLEKYFAAHREGPGIWKWRHYFEIYDRHFTRFRNREVHVLEIGIHSGGSLEMWRDYFGPLARIYGVDIQPACKAYENGAIRIFIGDQKDRGFWRRFKAQVPRLDIVIDDGCHRAEHQIAAFEELLPHLQPGGVYVCEDLHVTSNRFAGYIYGFASNLNANYGWERDRANHDRRLACKATALQSAVHAVHLYPFVTVIEKTAAPIEELVSPKHGTQWAPFAR
jgi:hypothetical protein